MGGAGSGRHSTYPTTVEDYEALAIESLVRDGVLRLGCGWTKTCSRNGRAMRSISAYAEQDTVLLSNRVFRQVAQATAELAALSLQPPASARSGSPNALFRGRLGRVQLKHGRRR